MPCPKGKELEESHRKLRDLGPRYVPSWLPDGTAELLDDVVGEVLKYIKGGDQLVIVEGFCRSLAKEKDSLEHVNCVLKNSFLNKGRVPLRVFCFFSVVIVIIIFDSSFVKVDVPLTLRLATGFQGFKLSARHQPFLQGLRAGPYWSCHCKASSPVKVERRKLSVSWSCD
jgi:hypothetical protein